MDGVVTNLGYEISEVARPNTTAVSLISISGVEIEANVPEVDVAKVAVGNPVSITLDAIPGETFTGKVTHIDPAETVVDGVTNYKIKISFDAKDPRIKSGVTANLDIETLRKPNTLTLPQFGIVERDEGKFVRKLVNGEVKEFPITAGIRSSDGYVEILSGVSEGDEVLNAGLKTN
ncbi:MAG: RND family efflux transporter MFP subunit [Parcubacteria group bacterium GW2011_GWC2_52_8c]|nr:MAG: RND family efflux transporter MFP subunit [Parcubacteria group bacterium GW2011_GWC2_52_8c]